MNVKVLHPNEMLSKEEIVNVKGGLNNGLTGDGDGCTCDCWIGNTNTETPVKPITNPDVKPIRP